MKTSFLVLLLSVALSSCGQKTTGKSTTNNYYSNGSSSTDSSTDSSTGTTYTFKTGLPDLIIKGPGTNSLYWSSATNLPSYIDPESFRADAKFAVRIKVSAVAGGTALANPTYPATNKACSTFTSNSFSKLQVKLMLRKSGVSLGETQTLTASVGATSSIAEFSVPSGSSSPFILEVVEVLSDHRCKQSNGSLYCPYADIPYNSGGPTECVGLKIEYATL